MPQDCFVLAAQNLGCEVAAIRAVFEIESAGSGFRKDGSVERRFEPHKMPGAKTTWRDSMKLSQADREAMFADAYGRNPEAALEATSWGAPQIMGFNHEAAGYPSATVMVERMAENEAGHLTAFVALLINWGLDSAIRAHDWLTFARRYNGNGQPEEYARRIESAYRKHSGRASPVVLRPGARGASVKVLQQQLGIEADGVFGPETDAAVRAFQMTRGLPVDGVVGKWTWSALNAQGEVPVKVQPTPADSWIGRVWKALGGLAGVGAVLAEGETLRNLLPPGAFDLLAYGAVVLALGAGGLYLLQLRRGAGRLS
jgi:hypothetical protein